jgi:hypothetical protein
MPDPSQPKTRLIGRVVTKNGEPAQPCLITVTAEGFAFPEMAVYSLGDGNFTWPFLVPRGRLYITARERTSRLFAAEGYYEVPADVEEFYVEVGEI